MERPDPDFPEFEPPETGLGKVYMAAIVIVCAVAAFGACIAVQLLDRPVNP